MSNTSFSWNFDNCSKVKRPLLFAVRVSRPGGKAISLATRNTVLKLFWMLSSELWIKQRSEDFKYDEYYSTIVLASSSLYVLVPPLCFLFMWRWRLPYDPNILEHDEKGHEKFFSIWSLVLRSALCFLLNYEFFLSWSVEQCVQLFCSVVDKLFIYETFNSLSGITFSVRVSYVMFIKLFALWVLGVIFICSLSFSF